MQTTLGKIVGLGLLASLTTAALAHHSPARFRVDQVVAITGTVERVDWTNPHTYFFVKDEADRTWRLEANATSILRRAGWQPETVTVGDTVTVRANPPRSDSSNHGRLLSLVAADGRVLSTSSEALAPGDAEPRATTSLAGTWRGNAKEAFKFLFAFIDHPLTERGEQAVAEFDDTLDPIAACETWPTPRLTAWTAFYLSEIELGDEIVTITNEFGRAERTIYLDGREHPSSAQHFPQGFSIGHWEDDVLVVDTRNFTENRSPIADGIPSSPERRVVERFRLDDDGTRLHIHLQVFDPVYLAEPFDATLTWQYSPTLSIEPFDCDPEIARRFLD